jgi:ABC-type glycerol-3-phosphate transport system permease component
VPVAILGVRLVDAKASAASPFFTVVLLLDDCCFLLMSVALFLPPQSVAMPNLWLESKHHLGRYTIILTTAYLVWRQPTDTTFP